MGQVIKTSGDLERLPRFAIVHSGYSVWQKYGDAEWYEPRSSKRWYPHKIVQVCTDEWGHVDLTVVYPVTNIEPEDTKPLRSQIAAARVKVALADSKGETVADHVKEIANIPLPEGRKK